MAERPTHTVEIDALRDLMERLFRAVGMEPDISATVTDVFVEAELRGVGIQGLHYTHALVRNLETGRINPNGRPTVVAEGAATALVDGDAGPGAVASVFAADLCAGKARETGCATVGVTNTSDIFMLAYYVERIARAGLAGLLFMNSPPTLHPTGGVERVIGTNPFAIAVPTAGPHPLVLDIAAGATLLSIIRLASRHGESIPLGWALDRDGRPTTDANEAKLGAVSPVAGHKGYGLGFWVALLSGCLVGADVGKVQARWHTDEPGRAPSRGHLYIAIDPAAFGGMDVFRAAVGAYIDEIKASRTLPGATIRFPGERSFAERERSLARGTVDIDGWVWNLTAEIAARLGVAMPG